MTPDEEKYVEGLENESKEITSVINKLKRHAFVNGVDIISIKENK
jgi:hypothetical protein